MKSLRYRLTCIITLVVVTIGSILNPVFTLRSEASEVVLDGTLGELLVELLITFGSAYLGHDVFDSFDSSSDIYKMSEDELFEFLMTEEGQALLYDLTVKDASSGKMVNVGKLFGADHMVGGGSSPGGGKDPKYLLSQVIGGIGLGGTAGLALYNFSHGYFDYVTDPANESELGAAIIEACNQDVYFVNPILPEYIYIGYNSDLIPGTAVLANYDTSVSHLQYYSNDAACYRDIQVSRQNADRWAGETIEAACYIDYDYPELVKFGSSYYMYDPRSYLKGTSIISTLDSYVFGTDGYYRANSRPYMESSCATVDHPVYISPAIGQPALIRYNDIFYLIYSDGTVSTVINNEVVDTAPSELDTILGYLTSVQPIVQMDISSFVDAIGKAIADAHPAEDSVLTSEAISQIYNNVSNVYDNAVSNFYNDTSYIDQSQYITNITNVYNEAIADNPVITIPDSDAGILSAIKAIPGQIAKVLEDIFIPDLTLYKYYFLDIKSKFAFIDDISAFGTNLITILFNSDPEIPKIVIDFNLAESKYDYGGRTYALDMTFYARFKPLVDNIIVSFSWLAFAYWFYKNLPEIISGTILSRKDYAVVKETGNTLLHGDGTFSKTRVKEIRDIDKIVTEKPSKKK